MDEETFNISMRKFLKKVGVTSQQELEKAVREAIRTGQLQGNEHLAAEVTLRVGTLNLTHQIDGEIKLAD